MPIKTDVEAKEAKHGEKMIELKVRFWTDDMSTDQTWNRAPSKSQDSQVFFHGLRMLGQKNIHTIDVLRTHLRSVSKSIVAIKRMPLNKK